MTAEELHELRILLIKEIGREIRHHRRSVMAGCMGKRRFDSHNHAMQSIKPDKRGIVNAYRCQHCGSWHLGGRRSSRNMHRVQTTAAYGDLK